jgi:hypothetical protein
MTTGKELANRLLEDINKSVAIRQKVQDPFTQVRNIGISGQADLSGFMSSLNVLSFDGHLDILSQFINFHKRLVNHDKGTKVDIAVWQKDVQNNLDEIAHTFQEIISSDTEDVFTETKFSEFLIEQLGYLHDDAN